MIDQTPKGGGRPYTYSGEIRPNGKGEEFGPFYKGVGAMKVDIPPGSDVYNQGVEVPVIRPLDKARPPLRPA
jgi:hypothetical protein